MGEMEISAIMPIDSDVMIDIIGIGIDLVTGRARPKAKTRMCRRRVLQLRVFAFRRHNLR